MGRSDEMRDSRDEQEGGDTVAVMRHDGAMAGLELAAGQDDFPTRQIFHGEWQQGCSRS